MALQPASETLRAENADCTLTVTLTAPTPVVLRLHYSVHNRGPVSLYLLNQLWKNIRHDQITDTEVIEVDPNLANVDVGAVEVVVNKAVVDVPYGMLAETRHIPCVVRVAAGSIYEETIDLPAPLAHYSIYESMVQHGPVVARPLRFELGYLRGLPHTEAALKPVATPTGQAFWINAFPAKSQSIIGVGPFQTPVAVLQPLDRLPPKPASTGKWTPWD